MIVVIHIKRLDTGSELSERYLVTGPEDLIEHEISEYINAAYGDKWELEYYYVGCNK